jgi:hypothetical protein
MLPPPSPLHRLLWRWRQHGTPKRRYPTTTLHGVTTQKNSTWKTWPPWKPLNQTVLYILNKAKLNITAIKFSDRLPTTKIMNVTPEGVAFSLLFIWVSQYKQFVLTGICFSEASWRILYKYCSLVVPLAVAIFCQMLCFQMILDCLVATCYLSSQESGRFVYTPVSHHKR